MFTPSIEILELRVKTPRGVGIIVASHTHQTPTVSHDGQAHNLLLMISVVVQPCLLLQAPLRPRAARRLQVAVRRHVAARLQLGPRPCANCCAICPYALG